MKDYKMTVVYLSGEQKTKTIRKEHKFAAYTSFLKSIPVNQLENIKAIWCEDEALEGESV